MLSKVKLKELIVWSDNPRLDVENEDENKDLTEQEIIDVLWEQVGLKDMLELAENINQKGFRESRPPIVVSSNKKYLVYDGNRRVSCGKLIASKDARLKFKGFNISLDTELYVSVVSHEQALEEMDEIHAGSKGIKIIAWDAFTRDKALFKNGKSRKYSKAFEFSQKAGLKTKSAFKDVNYTDLDSILKNKQFMAILNDKFEEEKEQFHIMKKIKMDLNIKAWSRFLPEFNEKEEIREKVEALVNESETRSKPKEGKTDNKSTSTKEEKEDLVLLQKDYYGTEGVSFDLKLMLKLEKEILDLNNLKFDLNTSGLKMNPDSGKVLIDNPKGDYYLYVVYKQEKKDIVLHLAEHTSSGRGNQKSRKVVIDQTLYDECYRKTFQLSKPTAYLIKYLHETEVTSENKYAIAILYRQFIEFLYKMAVEKKFFNSDNNNITKDLAGGIISINNYISQIEKFKDQKKLSKKVRAFVELIQQNAHNIDGIDYTEINALNELLTPYIKIVVSSLYEEILVENLN